MFLNKFWNWVERGHDEGPILVLILILMFAGGIILLSSGSIFFISLAAMFWISLSEWMYLDYVKVYKKPKDLGLVKFGCLVGTFPFVAVPMAILANWNGIWNGIFKILIEVVSYPVIHKIAFYTLVLAMIVSIIVLYFWVNILIAKNIIKNNNKKTKKGGK